MKRVFFKFFLMFLIFGSLEGNAQSDTNKNIHGFKNVLLIDSYNDNFIWSRNIIDGITESFTKSKLNIRLSIEHLDQRLYSNTYTFDKIASHMKEKYMNVNFDLIITSDNSAFNFTRENREFLFPNIPIVFCGYNNLDTNELKGIKNVTGINEQINIEDMIGLVESIHPKLKNLVLITSTKDHQFQELSNLCDHFIIQNQSDLKIINMVDVSSTELEERLSLFAKETAVIVFGLLNDEQTPLENSKTIASLSPFPVYTNWDYTAETGVVGGIIIKGYDQGSKAAELAIQILYGKKADQIPIIMETPVQKIFDYNNLSRFNIPLSKLPKDRIIINEPISLYYTHKPIFIGLIFIIITLVIVFGTLIFINTQKRLFQRNFKNKENQLLRISNNLVNGFIFQIDTGIDGKSRQFTFVSDSITNFISITPSQLYEDSNVLYNRLYPDDIEEHVRLENEAIRSNSLLMMEGRMITNEGNIKHFQSTSIPHRDERGHLLFDGIIVDISKLKKTEEELLTAKHKAEESTRLITAFLTNLSHEIRTPMNGIVGFIDVVKNLNINQSEKSHYIESFQQSSNRFLKTLDDIILMAKIQSSKIPLQNNKVEINYLMNNLFDLFMEKSLERSLSFSWNKDFMVPQYFMITDSEKLMVIMSNLIENAIKYTENGFVEFGYRIDQGTILFFVKDSGMGISKENFDFIFDRFVQADMNNDRPFEGSGIGLSIAKAYVEMLQGEIWVESTEFVGSNFYVRFPLDQPNSDSENNN